MTIKNRELQIRLAQLQADIRIHTAGIFACVAVVVTLLLPVFGYGLEFWETLEISNPRIVMSVILTGFAVVFAFAAFRFYRALITSRNELDNLK